MWSNQDSMYSKIGMNYLDDSKPSYHHIIGAYRKNRFLYRKDVFLKMGFCRLIYTSFFYKFISYFKQPASNILNTKLEEHILLSVHLSLSYPNSINLSFLYLNLSYFFSPTR